jgi:DNA-binding transcriptional LysR family regulator
MKALQDLEIFVRTVETGSLSATARALGMTPAAASATLKRLEAELGVELLVRSTRKLKLSAHGELFLAQCKPALQALQQAKLALTQGPAEIEGPLKLSMPSDLGRNVLVPLLDDFQRQHPGIELRLQLSDRLANVFSEPVDAAIRYGVPPDSDLVALPLLSNARRVLCAAPAYLKQHGLPHTPQELVDHNCLCFMLGDKVHDRWEFISPLGKKLNVRVRATQVANDGDVVRRWALLGRGIAYKAQLDVAADIQSGNLEVLCNDWQTEPSPLYLVVPNRNQYSPTLKRLREFLVQCFQST